MAWTSPLPERYLSVCWPLQHQRPLQSYQIFFTLKMFHWTNSPGTNQSLEATSQPQIGIASPKPKMDIDKTHVWASQVDWFATLTSASNGKGQRNFRRNSAVRLNWQSIDSNAPTRSNKFTNKFTNKIQQVHSHLKYQSEKTERLWIPVSRLAIFLIKWKYRQQHCSDDSLDTQIVVGVQCNTKMQLPANPTNGLTKPLRNWVDDHPL